MDAEFKVIRKDDKSAAALMEGSTEGVVAWLKNQMDTTPYEIWSDATGYLTVAEFLNRVVNAVPKFYDMNPKTEDLLPNGSYLADGMKVLIGESNHRGRPEEMGVDWMRDKVYTVNRWCTVSRLTIVGNHVSFIGIYEDGTKRGRSMSKNEPWLVKIDSISESLEMAAERRKSIHDVIFAAFEKHSEVCCMSCNHDAAEPTTMEIIEKATDEVLGIH